MTSLLGIKEDALVLSQFTLFADTSKGRKPSFFNAASPQKAKLLFDYFIEKLLGYEDVTVKQGLFGERMIVDTRNLGPFSIPVNL